MEQLFPELSGRQRDITLKRLTMIWGFSEAAMGGMMHALKLPFTGLFAGSAAVILLSLLAYFGATRKEVCKATIIVLAVKAFVSPHTPVTAYLAVSVQGLLGCLLPGSRRWFMPRVCIVAVTALLLSALQKLIFLTLLFGKTFWDSVDLFINFAIEQLLGKGYAAGSYSTAIAGVYVAIHLLGGAVVTVLVYRITKGNPLLGVTAIHSERGEPLQRKTTPRKRRNWFLRPTGLILLALTAGTYLITTYYPEAGKLKQLDIVIMAIRSITIMLAWFLVLSPFISRAILRQLNPESRHAVFMKEVESMFPVLKGTAHAAWVQAEGNNILAKTSRFILLFIGSILLLPPEGEG